MKEYKFKINGTDYAVAVGNVENGKADVTVNGTPFDVSFEGEGRVTTRKAVKQVASDPSAEQPVIPAGVSKPAATSAPKAMPVKSPLPGVILDITVGVGQQVREGDKLLVLEAMKMENNIDSIRAGVVRSINVQRGDSVLEGDVLLTIE